MCWEPYRQHLRSVWEDAIGNGFSYASQSNIFNPWLVWEYDSYCVLFWDPFTIPTLSYTCLGRISEHMPNLLGVFSNSSWKRMGMFWDPFTIPILAWEGYRNRWRIYCVSQTLPGTEWECFRFLWRFSKPSKTCVIGRIAWFLWFEKWKGTSWEASEKVLRLFTSI